MVTLNDLMAFLNDFMGDAGDRDPHMPNGLQVRGREEIKLLATGVSASQRLFEEGVACGAKISNLVPWDRSVRGVLKSCGRYDMHIAAVISSAENERWRKGGLTH